MVTLELNGKLPTLDSAENLYAEALTYAALPFIRKVD
jgi:hypothetical protein